MADLGLITKNLLQSTSKNAPNLLAVFSIGGVIITTTLAIDATKKALWAMQSAEIDYYRRLSEDDETLMPEIERYKAAIPFFIPTLVSAGLTITAIILGNRMNAERTAALATLYMLSEANLNKYQAKVVEVFGPKKEEKIQEELVQDKLLKNPVEQNIIIAGRGPHLCFDSLSGRYFKSDMEIIRKAVNDINEAIVSGDMYASLNDFYSEIGLEPTEMGQNMGWAIDKGLLEIKYMAKISTSNEPCIVLEYKVKPRYL